MLVDEVEFALLLSEKPPTWDFLTCPLENECLNGHNTCDPASEVCVDSAADYECKCKAGFVEDKSATAKKRYVHVIQLVNKEILY